MKRDVAAALEAARHAIAAAQAAVLAAEEACAAPVSTTPALADVTSNPLGSARSFLDAGRAGHFATWRRGRHVVAAWDDVERYARSRGVRRKVRSTPANEPSDRQLLAAGRVRASKRSA